MNVLLVDFPDSPMADFVDELLEAVSRRENFTVLTACDEHSLIDLAESFRFDLAVIIPNNFKFPETIVIEDRLRQSLEYSERLQANGCVIIFLVVSAFCETVARLAKEQENPPLVLPFPCDKDILLRTLKDIYGQYESKCQSQSNWSS